MRKCIEGVGTFQRSVYRHPVMYTRELPAKDVFRQSPVRWTVHHGEHVGRAQDASVHDPNYVEGNACLCAPQWWVVCAGFLIVFVGASWHASKEPRLRSIACFRCNHFSLSGAMWVTDRLDSDGSGEFCHLH